MSKLKSDTVYDDSTDMQLRTLSDFTTGPPLSLNDLAKPETVQLMITQQMITLTELRSAKADAVELRRQIKQLTDDRERLRIDLAKSKERRSILWLEVPMGVLFGFATKMLTTNSADGTGWVLLVVSLAMLVILRTSPRSEAERKETNVQREN